MSRERERANRITFKGQRKSTTIKNYFICLSSCCTSVFVRKAFGNYAFVTTIITTVCKTLLAKLSEIQVVNFAIVWIIIFLHSAASIFCTCTALMHVFVCVLVYDTLWCVYNMNVWLQATIFNAKLSSNLVTMFIPSPIKIHKIILINIPFILERLCAMLF